MVMAQNWHIQNYLVEQLAQSRYSKSLLFPLLHVWKPSIFFFFFFENLVFSYASRKSTVLSLLS